MPTAKITSKGQITIPKKVREELHLKSGDKISIETEGNSARIIPNRTSILDRAGALQDFTKKKATLKEMNDAIAKGISEKYERS
jgi:AbrB family looped-hinge helix DNA binding protein